MPSTRLARASDDILNAQVPKLTRASASLNARMTATDQATVAPLIAEVNTQVTAAQAAATGISATVEADTPAQWDANHGLLRAAANSVKAARTDLKTAAADIKQIRSDLKAAH